MHIKRLLNNSKWLISNLLNYSVSIWHLNYQQIFALYVRSFKHCNPLDIKGLQNYRARHDSICSVWQILVMYGWHYPPENLYTTSIGLTRDSRHYTTTEHCSITYTYHSEEDLKIQTRSFSNVISIVVQTTLN